MVSPQKFRFNKNKYAELTIDVIVDVAFDSDNGETSAFLNRSAVASDSYDGRYKHTARYRYDELFSPRFTIVKADFSDFTRDEVRQVLRYLTQTDVPALLEVYYNKDSKVVDWAAMGGWTEISTYKLGNNRTVGIVATFEAITPYAMSDVYGRDENDNPIKYDITEDNKIEIDIDTDDNQPVYPRITIRQKGIVVDIDKPLTADDDMVINTVYHYGTAYYWKTEGSTLRSDSIKPYDWPVMEINRDYTIDDTMAETTLYYNPNSQKYFWRVPYTFNEAYTVPNLTTTSVKISNNHKDSIDPKGNPYAVIVKNNTSTEEIVIDCANRIISSSNTRRIFGDDFNWMWLELFNGKNEITVEGNCEITIEYRTVIKCGEY
jgi:hypothetical protein